jgi:hypothetical protein
VIVNSTGNRLLAFNYLSPRTKPWRDPALAARGDHALYPAANGGGITIDLLKL